MSGWRLSLSAMLGLWNDVRGNVKFLLPRRLNQNSLESYFSSIRQKGGCRDNPSSAHFRSAMRSCVANKLLTGCGGENCKVDDDSVLLSLDSLATIKSSCATSFVSRSTADLVFVQLPPPLPVSYSSTGADVTEQVDESYCVPVQDTGVTTNLKVGTATVSSSEQLHLSHKKKHLTVTEKCKNLRFKYTYLGAKKSGNLLHINAITYVSGYVAHKVLKNTVVLCVMQHCAAKNVCCQTAMLFSLI